MQTIGKMEDGRVLAVINDFEYHILAMVIEETTKQALTQPVAGVAGPVSPGTPPATAAAATKATPRSGAQCNRHKQCVICGKNFVDATRTNSRKVCIKETCKSELHKRQRAKHRKAGLATVRKSGSATLDAKRSTLHALPANPASPFLTDEQRKEMMARREKLIAESARRHREEI